MRAIDPSPPLSVVIPTLNAADQLGDTLAALASGRDLIREITLADGGSGDATAGFAREWGIQVVRAPRGRGLQLAAGAAASQGRWLCFLHADSRLQPGWAEAARRFIVDPANVERAGYFRYCLYDAAPAARRLERIVAWRSRRLGLPYGDQGLLISRRLYDRLGGFPALPLMEDVAWVRRVGRQRLVALDAASLTSAARYRREGYIRRPLRNLFCLACYLLGVPPRLIRRFYG